MCVFKGSPLPGKWTDLKKPEIDLTPQKSDRNCRENREIKKKSKMSAELKERRKKARFQPDPTYFEKRAGSPMNEMRRKRLPVPAENQVKFNRKKKTPEEYLDYEIYDENEDFRNKQAILHAKEQLHKQD